MREIDRGLRVIDHPQRLRGGLELPTRTTLVELADGGQVALSPGPLASTPLDAVRALGPLRALVEPNLVHYLYLAEWAEAFPDARRLGPPGLERKLRGTSLHEALGDAPPALWAGTLDQLHVAGVPILEEWAFLHRPTGTLILTDLAFHLRHLESRVSRALMRLNDAYDRFGPSRMIRSRLVTRDRAALRASVGAILGWDFDRVVVAHGEVLEKGGRQAVRDAFAWLEG